MQVNLHFIWPSLWKQRSHIRRLSKLPDVGWLFSQATFGHPLASTCIDFSWAQICTQIYADFHHLTTYHKPTQVDCKSSVYAWNLCLFVTSLKLRTTCESVWQPITSPYTSSGFANLHWLVSLFGQGFTDCKTDRTKKLKIPFANSKNVENESIPENYFQNRCESVIQAFTDSCTLDTKSFACAYKPLLILTSLRNALHWYRNMENNWKWNLNTSGRKVISWLYCNWNNNNNNNNNNKLDFWGGRLITQRCFSWGSSIKEKYKQ